MEPALGIITMFSGDFAPRRWALCQGQLLPINQNQALFSILGTAYGGDGRVNFALPDLRGRAPVHIGQGAGTNSFSLGEKSGVESIALTAANLPAHGHQAAFSLWVSTNAATHDEPEAKVLGRGAVNAFQTSAATNGQLGGVTVTVQASGANQPVGIRQPYLCIHFIICLSGIFPSRN
jgi:microcystin-dependent protein